MQLNNIVNLPQKQEVSYNYDIKSCPEYLLNDEKASTYIVVALNLVSRHDEAIELFDMQKYSSTIECVYCIDSLIQQNKINEANKYLEQILNSQPYNVELFKQFYALLSKYIDNNVNINMLKETYNQCANSSNNLIKLYPSSILLSTREIDLL